MNFKKIADTSFKVTLNKEIMHAIKEVEEIK